MKSGVSLVATKQLAFQRIGNMDVIGIVEVHDMYTKIIGPIFVLVSTGVRASLEPLNSRWGNLALRN